MLKTLLPLIPSHRIYVEVFGGAAHLLFAKSPSPIEVYNDLDRGLVGFFKVLRDPEKAEQLMRLLELTPYSRAEYYEYRDTWETIEDDVERARRWFTVANQSFSAIFGRSWSFNVSASCKGVGRRVSQWQTSIARIQPAVERLRYVQVECRDFRFILKHYDTPETFFYCDPPYVMDTRRGGGYHHEMCDDDHRNMVDMLLKLEGKAILSGYTHPIYAPLEQMGWSHIEYSVACSSIGKTRTSGRQGDGSCKNDYRTETVWINPAAQREQYLQLCLLDSTGANAK